MRRPRPSPTAVRSRRKPCSSPPRATASSAASRSSSMARKVGAASSGSCPSSWPETDSRFVVTRLPSGPPARCTQTSFADACRPKTKSIRETFSRRTALQTKATANQFRSSSTPAIGRVGTSHVAAEALDVGRRPVRHLAPAPHQDRRPRRRNENVIRVLADLMPGARYSAPRFATHTAPRHLNDRWRGPSTVHNSPFNPQPPPTKTLAQIRIEPACPDSSQINQSPPTSRQYRQTRRIIGLACS